MMKKLSIPALSLIICGCTMTSVLADSTMSDEECAQISRQYDDAVGMRQGLQAIGGHCQVQIGGQYLCARTDQIQAQKALEDIESEIAQLEDELITNCPDYAEGLQ
jgi:hypothetical protein